MALANTTKIFVRNPVGVLTNHGDIRILGLQCLAQVGLLQNFNLILFGIVQHKSDLHFTSKFVVRRRHQHLLDDIKIREQVEPTLLTSSALFDL